MGGREEGEGEWGRREGDGSRMDETKNENRHRG